MRACLSEGLHGTGCEKEDTCDVMHLSWRYKRHPSCLREAGRLWLGIVVAAPVRTNPTFDF